MSGWICSYRKIWQHPLFRGNAQRVGAWHWMMHMAVVADTRFMADGREVRLSRGQFCASQQQICDATGMTRKQVRSFLDALEAESAVVLKRANDAANGRTIVTICNYDQYQNMPASEGPSKGQARAKQGPTKEQVNTLTKESPLPPKGGDDGFSAFWDVYPHRGGQKKNRKGAEARYRAAIKSGATAEQIMAGVNAMSAFPDVQRGYARDPATWLNQAGWTDEAPSGFAVIKGGVDKSMWVEGALRAVSPTNIQEYVCGSWEKRNDLTEEQVTGHPKYIGRTRAYAV